MKKYFSLILSIITLVFSITFIFFNDFNSIVLQWDTNYTENVVKAWYYFLLLSFTSIFLAILRIKLDDYPQIYSFISICLDVYCFLIILYNLNILIPVPFIVLMVVEVTYIVVGFKLRSCKKGDKLAINLEYLKDNDEAWLKTQKLGSVISIISGSLAFCFNLLYVTNILSISYAIFSLIIISFIACLIIIKKSYKYV